MFGKIVHEIFLNTHKSSHKILLRKTISNSGLGAGEKSVNVSKLGCADSWTNYQASHVAHGICLS